jgi:hypothetical protein
VKDIAAFTSSQFVYKPVDDPDFKEGRVFYSSRDAATSRPSATYFYTKPRALTYWPAIRQRRPTTDPTNQWEDSDGRTLF